MSLDSDRKLVYTLLPVIGRWEKNLHGFEDRLNTHQPCWKYSHSELTALGDLLQSPLRLPGEGMRKQGERRIGLGSRDEDS